MIPKAKIEAVLREADIVKVVGDHIPLQKRGRNYFAVCPFHDEKTPSMSVSREKKIYKCFSCGAQGNAIRFLEDYLHLSFLEALRTIASDTTVNLDSDFASLTQTIAKYSPQQRVLFEINEAALQYFKVSLASKYGKEALDYLRQRGFSLEEVQKWDLGYSHSQLPLHQFLLEKGYTIEQLKNASLITIKKEGIHNYFNNRLIFPIRDLDGNLIGFSGRSLLSNESIKYLNSRETLVFKKAHILFNINRALRAINKSRTIILTEGFMDVFSLTRIGFEQTIATMGTNFSDFHLNSLKKLGATVILFFDGDQAGIQANIKAAAKLMLNGLKVKVVDNPTSFDPDELVKSGQEPLIKNLIDCALHPWDYVVDKLQTVYDLDQYDQLKTFLAEVYKILKINNEPIMIDQVLKKLEIVTKLDYGTLKESYYGKKFVEPKPHIPTKQHVVLDTWPYREILGALAQSPSHIDMIESNWELIYKTINEQEIDFILVLKAVIKAYQKGVYQPNDWDGLRQIFERLSFDYKGSRWNLSRQWLMMAPQAKDLTPAFLVLEERYWHQKELYYREKLEKTTNRIARKNYWLQQKRSREKLLNLRKKRTEWQWKK